MNVRVYTIGYSSQERVDRCLGSVPEHYERILLDNSGGDLTPPDGCECITIGPARFTEGFNACLRDAMIHNAIPVILNDDIVVELDCISHMMSRIEDGLVAPIQLQGDNPDHVIYRGSGAAYPAGQHLTGDAQDAETYRPTVQKWLNFAAVAIHPNVIRQVGLLDPQLKMWFSDSDYCMRARRHGFKCWIEPKAMVRHEHSVSVQEMQDTERMRLWVHDQDLFFRKWGGVDLASVSG